LNIMSQRSISPDLLSSSPIAPEDSASGTLGSLDLSGLPPIFVLQGRVPIEQLHDLEEALSKYDAPLTYDASEAQIFLTAVGHKKRATFELRAAGVWNEEVQDAHVQAGVKRSAVTQKDSARVKRRDFSLRSSQPEESEEDQYDSVVEESSAARVVDSLKSLDKDTILVIKLDWIHDSIEKHMLLDFQGYLVFTGRRTTKQMRIAKPEPRVREVTSPPIAADSILQRAREDTPPSNKGPATRFASAPHGSRRFRDQAHRAHWSDHTNKPALIELETRSSQEEGSTDHVVIPPPPDWVRQKLKFACQRITPMYSPNEEFIELLMKIRLARRLTSDEIGVRAYSSAIASIAALNTVIVSPKEITRLPSCDVKFANLWIEYHNTGTINAAKEVDTDETLKILNSFYEIWGVGDKTAREFHFERGWVDIDDLIEYGWDSLTRVQQIGVKYYDEFKIPIPRLEVQEIIETVKQHAVKVRDEGIEILAVGGYRRGKEASGDVDMIVSHRDLRKTENLVTDIVRSLEDEGWVTHTLRLDLRGTHRGQEAIPLKALGNVVAGSGFDTLDKAMVVWQDINWPSKQSDLEEDADANNPNLHRRVDIIVSPWRTVGCAVLGWSGGTTFQRDIRRYCKYEKMWKFDSSGIRHRRSGEPIKLEGQHGVKGSMEDAERAVFDGMGLEFRHPWERCTG
jgi:DNA polymerase IV